MKVFVINLKRRPDRLAAVTAALPPAWLQCAEFTTNWPGPVDGEKISSTLDLSAAGIGLYDGWEVPGSKNSWWNRPMKKGEIGCSYSHLSVWRRAREAFEQDAKLRFVIVLEDDVYCGAGHNANDDTRLTAPEKLEKVIDSLTNRPWDLLYLGRVLQGGSQDKPAIFPNQDHSVVVEPGFSYCAYGYVLSRTGVERLLGTDFHEALIPLDEFLPACYTMHPRLDISQMYPPILRAYSVHPYLIFQRTKYDGGSDTESSALWNTTSLSAKSLSSRKIRVRAVANWAHSEVLYETMIRQCIDHERNSQMIEFVTDDSYDWFVIFNDLRRFPLYEIKVPKERIIGFIQEPPHGDWFDKNIGSYCGVVYTCGAAYLYKIPGNIVGFPLGMFYQLDGHANEYLSPSISNGKTRQISMVTSGNSGGFYDYRLAIARELISTGWCDVFGRNLNYPGAKGGLKNKADGLLPYRFSVCVENGMSDDYISDKIIDAILCSCIPIYVGSKTVAQHIPFVIDLSIYYDKPKLLVEKIQYHLANTNYADYVQVMNDWKLHYFKNCSIYTKIVQTTSSLPPIIQTDKNVSRWFIHYFENGEHSFSNHAGHRIANEARALAIAAKPFFKEVITYRKSNLGDNYLNEFSEHYRHARGAGYWVWKARIVQITFEKMEMGDELMYADTGCEIKGDLSPLFNLLQCQDIVPFHLAKEIEENWTKNDVFVELLNGIDAARVQDIKSTLQRLGGYFLMRKTPNTVKFVDEWVDILKNVTLVDDSPSSTPNAPGFQEHRHDQSVWSVLTKKQNISSYPDPGYPARQSKTIAASRKINQ